MTLVLWLVKLYYKRHDSSGISSKHSSVLISWNFNIPQHCVSSSFPKHKVSSYAYSARYFQQQMIPHSSMQIPGVLSLPPGNLFQCYLPPNILKASTLQSLISVSIVSEVLFYSYFILPHYTGFQKITLARKPGQLPH